MDDADIASVNTDAAIATAIAAKKPSGPEATGLCLYCEAPQANLLSRWCDADCRDAWQREESLRHRQGEPVW